MFFLAIRIDKYSTAKLWDAIFLTTSRAKKLMWSLPLLRIEDFEDGTVTIEINELIFISLTAKIIDSAILAASVLIAS
jgi:hypothetical protein